MPANSTFEHGIIMNLEVTPQSFFAQHSIANTHCAGQGRSCWLLCYDDVVVALHIHILHLLPIKKCVLLSPHRAQDRDGLVGIRNNGSEHWQDGLLNLASILSMVLTLLVVLIRAAGWTCPPEIGTWGGGCCVDIVGISGGLVRNGKSIVHSIRQRGLEVLWMTPVPATVLAWHIWKVHFANALLLQNLVFRCNLLNRSAS